MIRWIFTILIVVAVTAIGAAVWWLNSNGTPVQATRARLGPIRQFVDERGKTRLPEPVLITMPFAGRIEEISLSEGQVVRKGEVVARVSTKDLVEEVAEAVAAVERLAASLIESSDVSVETTAKTQADLYVKSMNANVAAAEAKLLAAKSRLEYAETFLGRVQKLVPSGAETEDDLELARLAHVEKQVAYRQDVLALESQQALQAATLLMPQLLTEYMTRKRLAADVLVKQKSEAEARLRIAKLRQTRGTIVSPIDGVVLQRAILDSQFLLGGAMLLRLGQLDALEVETDVLSGDAGRIRPGGMVEIYGPAIGESPAAGVVERVFPTGFTKISSLGVEQQRVTVIVRFDDGELAPLLHERNLGVDYRVRVRMITDQEEETLVVARSALFRNATGQWAVFAISHDHVELQTVEVGLMNDEHVEIRSGLNNGDAVVIAPENGLIEGAHVAPTFRDDA
jgi:HlyD family secretion protein